MSNLKDFEDFVKELEKKEKSILLYKYVENVESIKKIDILLKHGANPNISRHDVKLWRVAFAKDLFREENELVVPKLIPYIFANDEKEFINKANELIFKKWNEYKCLNNRSDIADNNLQNSNKIQKMIDNSYNDLVDQLAEDIDNLSQSYPAKQKPRLKVIK